VKLVPVDHNPFEQKRQPTFTPVEGNPFEQRDNFTLTPVESNPFEAEKRQQEVDTFEGAGGGFLTGLETGARRLKQTLAAGGAALQGALIDDEGVFDTSPVGEWLKGQGQRDREEVQFHQDAIQNTPQHPTIRRMVEAGNAADDWQGALSDFGSEFWQSPDKSGLVINQLGEQLPNFATFALGTKGAGNLLNIGKEGTKRVKTAKAMGALGAGAGVASASATFGPNVSEGLVAGLTYDDAEARAAKKTLAQAVVDGATGAILPLKIGPNQWVNVPAQAVIQMLGGGLGDAAGKVAVGEEVERGDFLAESLLELLGLPVELTQAAITKAASGKQAEPSAQAPPTESVETAQPTPEAPPAAPFINPNVKLTPVDGNPFSQEEIAEGDALLQEQTPKTILEAFEQARPQQQSATPAPVQPVETAPAGVIDRESGEIVPPEQNETIDWKARLNEGGVKEHDRLVPQPQSEQVPVENAEVPKKDTVGGNWIKNPDTGVMEPPSKAQPTQTEETASANSLDISFETDPTADKALLTKDRAELRKHLNGILPKQVTAIKNKEPEQYRAILKSMVRKLFPKGAHFQFRKDGNVVDYDHLLTDKIRENYIHTLPDTLKQQHIKVEFQNGDVRKAYLIKKYFDPEIQKDIWDMIVTHDNEVRTKITRKDKRGRGYVESQILKAGKGAGVQASDPSTTTENKASTTTQNADTGSIIGQGTEDIKGAQDLKKPSTDRIDDLGEKIGGARKDLVVKRGASTKQKNKNSEPAWKRRFPVIESVLMGSTAHGKWQIFDNKTGRVLRGMVFNTEQEAVEMQAVAAVAVNHAVMGDGNGGYTIWRKNSKRRVRVIPETFTSHDDAMAYMASHATELLETKLSFGEEILPTPEVVYRTGEERRKGDIVGQDFMDTFGFRGVEFGNWNNQEERQQVMNHAYDALFDLAEIINVDPLALSLNGDLALAFGARGQGLSGAKAHYEPSHSVINLTKMSGAGSLAHEWFHGLDHYFARIDGSASSEKILDSSGNKVFKGNKGAGMASHGFLYNSKAREELRKSYKHLITTMFKKAETYVEDTKRAENFVRSARDELKLRISDVRSNLERQLDTRYYKRKNKPATEEQLSRFDVLTDQLINGESVELELRQNENSRARYGSYRQSNDVLDEMEGIYKAVRGRAGFKADKKGAFDRIQSHVGHYQNRIKTLKDADTGAEKIKNVPTDFYMQARSADQARTSDYWSSEHEMAARAFAAYVEDRLAANDAKNDFLAYHAHGAVIVPVYPDGFFRPYPEGKERVAVNKAFDKLFTTIENKKTDKGIALQGRQPTEYHAKQVATKTKPRTVLEIRTDYADVVLEWGSNSPRVKAVQSVSDLPSVGNIKYKPTLAGLHVPTENTMYLVADNLPTKKEVWRFVAHEAVGHHAMEHMLGPELYSRTLDKVLLLRDKGDPVISEIAAEVEETYSDYSEEQQATEIIARLAERQALKSKFGAFFDKIVLAIRKFLRKLKLGTTWSHRDIEEMLTKAEKFLKEEPLSHRSERMTAIPDALFNRHIGDASVDIGKNGISGVSRYLDKHPDILNDLPHLFSMATVKTESSDRATLENGGIEFYVVKKDGEWHLTDLETTNKERAVGRVNEGRKESNGDSERNFESMSDIEDAVKQNRAALKDRSWKDVISWPKNYRRAMTGWMDGDQINEFYGPMFSGMKGGNALNTYNDLAGDMNAYVENTLHEAANVDEEWAKLSSKEATFLDDVMSDATYYETHPDQGFVEGIGRVWAVQKVNKLEGQIRSRPGEAHLDKHDQINAIKNAVKFEKVRRDGYATLKHRFSQMNEQQKKVYKLTETAYEKQWDALLDELEAKVRESAPGEEGAAAVANVRTQMHKKLKKGPYFPMSRHGDFVVIATNKQGEFVREHAETEPAQKRIARMLQRDGFAKDEIRMFKVQNTPIEEMEAAPGMAREIYKLVDKHVIKNEALKDDINQYVLRMMPGMSFARHGIHRKKTLGFSRDQRRAFNNTMLHGAKHISRVKFGHKMQAQLSRLRDEIKNHEEGKPSSLTNETGNIASDVVNELHDRHERIMNPNSHPVTALAGNLSFAWYLGMSPAAGIVNLAQTPMLAYPKLAARYGPGKAAGALTKALADYSASPFKASVKESWKSLSRNTKITSDEREMIEARIKDGTIEVTQSHSIASLADTDIRGSSSAGEMSTRRRQIMLWTASFFHNAETLNREVTTLAAYRLAKEKGESNPQKVAKELNNASHFNYASYNRPRYMKNDFVKVALVLKTFSQKMTYTLVRDAWLSRPKALGNKAEAEVKKIARRELTLIFGMTWLMAGAKGLPLIPGAIFGILDSVLGDEDDPFNSEAWFRTWLRGLIGPVLEVAFTKGPVNAFTPFDTHSRLSLNELIIRSPDREKEGRDTSLYYLEQAAGPIFSIFSNMAQGLSDISNGEYQRGFEKMTPKWIKDYSKAMRFNNEGVLSYSKDPIIEDTTLGEEIGQAFGFAPSRLNDRYDRRSAVKNKEAAITNRRSKFFNRDYNAWKKRDKVALDEVRKDIVAFNKKNPRHRISLGNLQASRRARKRADRQTENGIYNSKRNKHFRDEVQFGQ